MGKELDIDDVAAGHPMAQAYLSGMRAEAERLRGENATFRNAKLACEHCDPAGHAAAVAAERERYAPEIERLRNAIERLGSMEAFSISRSIRPGVDDELIARIDYARSILEA